jgi:hypothetical protein
MVAKQLRTVLIRIRGSVVASNNPDEGPPASTEARAELRDRETYYAELRFAVHCQSRSVPAPRAALDHEGCDAWTHGASEKSAREESTVPETGGTERESWDDMIAHFGDTWT